MKYEIVMMDLDGTALQNDRIHLSAHLLDVLDEVHRRGIHIVPITGRQYTSLPPIFSEGLNWKEYAVLCNGAEIRNLNDDNLLSAHYLTHGDVKNILRITDKYHAPMEITAGGYHVLTHDSVQWLRTNGGEAMKYHLDVSLPKVGIFVDDLYEYVIDNELFIQNVLCAFVPLEARQTMFEELCELPLNCVWGSKNGIEITHPEASKAKGMESVCQHLEIPLEKCFAIGDSGNDISMLKKAGFGVAMGNAPCEVKEVADYVASRNDEDGVAKAIERFVLEEH